MIGMMLVSDLYSYNLTVVLDFLTYQDKHHIKVCTVSVEIYLNIYTVVSILLSSPTAINKYPYKKGDHF